jgi:hypothetical protein
VALLACWTILIHDHVASESTLERVCGAWRVQHGRFTGFYLTLFWGRLGVSFLFCLGVGNSYCL